MEINAERCKDVIPSRHGVVSCKDFGWCGQRPHQPKSLPIEDDPVMIPNYLMSDRDVD